MIGMATGRMAWRFGTWIDLRVERNWHLCSWPQLWSLVLYRSRRKTQPTNEAVHSVSLGGIHDAFIGSFMKI